MKWKTQALRSNFFAGLFVAGPIALSVWLLYVLFGWASDATSILLHPKFLPQAARDIFFKQTNGEQHQTLAGRLLTLVVAVILLMLLGMVTRHVIGKGLVGRLEKMIGRVPLLNKIYPTVKEIVGTFEPGRQSAFREAVLVEFPNPGSYAIGFVTGETSMVKPTPTREPLITVFIPTSPNPTTGFLLFLPRHQLTPMKITVAEAFKLVISGGAVKTSIDFQPVVVTQADPRGS